MASVRSFLYHSNLIQTKCVTLRNANWTELVLFICSGADWTAWWPFTQQITTIPNNTICTRSGCDHRTELLSTAERQLFLIFSYVRLVSTHCDQQEICGTASCNRTPGYCLLLALPAAIGHQATACCNRTPGYCLLLALQAAIGHQATAFCWHCKLLCSDSNYAGLYVHVYELR